MEITKKDDGGVTLQLSGREYVRLFDVLRVFDSELREGNVDTEFLMQDKGEIGKFLTEFFEVDDVTF